MAVLASKDDPAHGDETAVGRVRADILTDE